MERDPEGKQKTVAKLKATVTQPEESSADKALYRLRIGPFNSHFAADTLCTKLEQQGESCLVIAEPRQSQSSFFNF